MRTIKFTKFTRIFLLLGCMLLLPAIKVNAVNPEWLYFENITPYLAKATNFQEDGENIWICIESTGLYKFNKETQMFVDSIIIPMSYFIRDNNGVFWICSGGLIKIDGANQTVYNKKNSGLPTNDINLIAMDSKNNLWISTNYYGLIKFDGVNWTIYNTKNSKIASNEISSLAIDKYDNIWIGTYDGGLAKFDGNLWTTYNTQNSKLPTNLVCALAIDKFDNKWIGTNGGLIKLNYDTTLVYNTTNSKIPDNFITNIAVDSSNNIWFGNHAMEHFYGLVKFNGYDEWTVYNTANSDIKGNSIYTISIDKFGNKWFSGSTSGFCIFKEGGIILSSVENNISKFYNKPIIYPNPVNDNLRIINYEFNSYTISDLTGKVILNGFNYNDNIFVGNLQTGIYTICLKDSKNIKFLKFLKN